MVLFTRASTPSQISRNNSTASQNQSEHGPRQASGSRPGSSDNSLQSRPRANTENPKRLSVFGGRSRSNTATSATSSYQSPATSMTSTDISSRRSSQDGRVPLNPAIPFHERPDSVAKSLLSRGSRILRRQGSKFSLASSLTLDEDEENERERYKVEVAELFQRGQKARSKSNTPSSEFCWLWLGL